MKNPVVLFFTACFFLSCASVQDDCMDDLREAKKDAGILWSETKNAAGKLIRAASDPAFIGNTMINIGVNSAFGTDISSGDMPIATGEFFKPNHVTPNSGGLSVQSDNEEPFESDLTIKNSNGISVQTENQDDGIPSLY